MMPKMKRHGAYMLWKVGTYEKKEGEKIGTYEETEGEIKE